MYVEFDVPDINEYPKGFPEYWLKSLFIQSPSERYQINALASTYMRLVEAALVEYCSGLIKPDTNLGGKIATRRGVQWQDYDDHLMQISSVKRPIWC